MNRTSWTTERHLLGASTSGIPRRWSTAFKCIDERRLLAVAKRSRKDHCGDLVVGKLLDNNVGLDRPNAVISHGSDRTTRDRIESDHPQTICS
jgi:hypothetical protein